MSRSIGKAGLVLTAKPYVDDPALVECSGNATRDRTWLSAQVDVDTANNKVYAADPIVNLQLEIAMGFALRRKEAMMFRPALAEVPAHALPANAEIGDYLAFVRVKHGTGGRVRYTAVRTDFQRQVLARAKAIAPCPSMYVGHAGLSSKQAMKRFSNGLSRCGVTFKGLGVTANGLRHQFAAELYFEITELRAPIKGGPSDAAISIAKTACLKVAHQLGHSRDRITNSYLGNRGRKSRQKSDSTT